MKIEEAIKILHPDTTREAIIEIEYYGGFNGQEKAIKAVEEACVVACECMEKQIPKKPTKEPTLYYENYCPTCKNLLDVRYKHCTECGQKLDWS